MMVKRNKMKKKFKKSSKRVDYIPFMLTTIDIFKFYWILFKINNHLVPH